MLRQDEFKMEYPVNFNCSTWNPVDIVICIQYHLQGEAAKFRKSNTSLHNQLN